MAIDTNEVLAAYRGEGETLAWGSAHYLRAVVPRECQRVYHLVGRSAHCINVLTCRKGHVYGRDHIYGRCTDSLVNDAISVFKLIADHGSAIAPALEARKLWQRVAGSEENGRGIGIVSRAWIRPANSRSLDAILVSTSLFGTPFKRVDVSLECREISHERTDTFRVYADAI